MNKREERLRFLAAGAPEQRTRRHLVGLHAAGRVRRDTGHLPLIWPTPVSQS